ncbi:MAG: hypothetical protein O3C27_13500 [Actinomycetota bacterium]|nr:hypothetical protein [Actinomycetota bacterium]
MMVAAVSLALLVIAIGVQVLARYVQRFGTDHRQPGPLIELRRMQLPTLQPADFEELEGIVSDGLVSDSHLDRQLLPLLRRLGATAPGGALAIERPGRRGRAAWLDDSLTRLERAWGL